VNASVNATVNASMKASVNANVHVVMGWGEEPKKHLIACRAKHALSKCSISHLKLYHGVHFLAFLAISAFSISFIYLERVVCT